MGVWEDGVGIDVWFGQFFVVADGTHATVRGGFRCAVRHEEEGASSVQGPREGGQSSSRATEVETSSVGGLVEAVPRLGRARGRGRRPGWGGWQVGGPAGGGVGVFRIEALTARGQFAEIFERRCLLRFPCGAASAAAVGLGEMRRRWRRRRRRRRGMPLLLLSLLEMVR
jgi:hypothetical protein